MQIDKHYENEKRNESEKREIICILSSLLAVVFAFESKSFMKERQCMKFILLFLFLLCVPSYASDSMQSFTSACSLQASADYCQSLEEQFFKNSLPFQEFSPHDFMAADYPADAKTLFLKMYSPKHTAALAYCYFVWRGAVDQKKVDPSLFARAVGGFMISSGELPAYEGWLKTDDGMQCRKNVENSAGLSVVDLQELLKNKLGLVALNPLWVVPLKADINRAMRDMKLTLNHERIHILHANCPTIDVFAKDSWNKLDPVRKAELKKAIPEYNWENQKLAVREYLAFTYEDNPAPVLDKAKGCEF